MNTKAKPFSSGVADEELNHLVDNLDIEETVYVPKIIIREKRKGEVLKSLGTRIPEFMIDDLKQLAKVHNANMDDMVAGILQSVLKDNLKVLEQYRKEEDRRRRKNYS